MTGSLITPGSGSGISYAGAATWAGRPSAASNANGTFLCTDFNTLMVSDGSIWRPAGGSGVGILRKALPMFQPFGNGAGALCSIGNNGALTLGSALPSIYSQCFMYFPVDSIAVGVPAGMYYTEMSSTTVGIIYNNTYTSGVPTAPTKTPFVTTGPGNMTQTTGSPITLLSFTLPGGLLANFGSVSVSAHVITSTSANAKTIALTYGGNSGGSFAYTTALSQNIVFSGRNMLTNKQIWVNNTASYGQSTSTSLYTATDSTADASIVITGQLAANTDIIGLMGYDIVVSPN